MVRQMHATEASCEAPLTLIHQISMTKTPHHRSRFLSLRPLLRWLLAFEVLASVSLVAALGTRPHITIFVATASAAGALVIVLVALALRMMFRDLPELERMSAKFDMEAAAQKNGQVEGPE